MGRDGPPKSGGPVLVRLFRMGRAAVDRFRIRTFYPIPGRHSVLSGGTGGKADERRPEPRH